MSIILIRSVILYFLVIFAVRLMGKRQLGELQPSELVITILISNIATLPLEDTNIPVLVGVTPILALVCFEVTASWLCLRVPFLRKLVSGSPKIVISNGKIDREVLRELRFSVDDIMMALRGNDIFDISEVQFAIVETTGSVSVMKKQPKDMPTREELGLEPECIDPPLVIVSDGKVLNAALRSLGLDKNFAERTAQSCNMKLADVFIMTADSSGEWFVSGEKSGKTVTMNGGKNDKDKNKRSNTVSAPDSERDNGNMGK